MYFVRIIINSTNVLFVRNAKLLILEHVEYKVNTALKAFNAYY